MAYNTPELQLVGSAQNLVLVATSSFELKELSVCRDDYPADIDAPSGEYNVNPIW